MSAARACSGQRVTSRSARRRRPSSTKNVPATAFNSVDFPEPLVPMMMTQEPAARSRFTPRRERTSFTVPGLKVFEMDCSSSMRASQAFFTQELRDDESEEDEYGGDQLQVGGTETPAQRHGNQQA